MQYTGIPILKHFGAFRPDQIEATSSASYAQVRYNDGVGPGTVWTELGHLSTVLNWALKRGFISYKPYIKCPAKPAPSEKFFTRPEIERLLSAPDTPHHIQLAMLLMLGTAGRQEAILELTWDRIDFHRGQIDLRRPAAYTRKGRAVVPMSEGLQSALTFAQTAAVSEYVIEWAGRRVKSIRRGLESVGRRAGVDGVSAHVFRHTAAVHMAEAGLSMSEISQFLGHSNTAITERVYARYSPTHLRRAADVLDFSTLKKGHAQ
ncbi:site-specific integrase [Roseivivax marinus]|uniref:tyrosine-type recombinase/integrase n=1 Tax=Roseivivax marinus TaxID=1379903 RepID=UPI001F033DE9|nr:site-specific integrase [Roseivivax marinus]UMA63583.1 site-specific integrase [Roseivivax marinus]